MRWLIFSFLLLVGAQKKAAKAAKGKKAPVALVEPAHAAVSTDAPQTPPVLTNAVTDWLNALRLAIDFAPGISNHHHARWMGLTCECIFKALQANKNKALTDDAVTAYAAHQFISYNFPQFQSGNLDPLLNVYLNYYGGAYPHRAALDDLVLPIVRAVLEREDSSGITNFVQNYVAPNTIGASQDILKKYEGQYQFTDVDTAKVPVSYKGKTEMMNWQERGHFGTIKPFFGPLTDYVQGLAPIVVGTAEYNKNLHESQKYGSNDQNSKDKYNWDTPFFWLHDWSHMPVVWTDIARAHLNSSLSNLETARVFAALGQGIFEACNANYGMKWGHLVNTSSLWRPITAIRSGDTYGNKAVSTWTPQLPTPMHPEFPSGHCAHSGAACEVLRQVLGGDKINMVIRTDYQDYNKNTPIQNRHYNSLTEVENDVMNARVFGGIHYRDSCKGAWVLAHKAAQSSYAHWFNKPDPNRASS